MQSLTDPLNPRLGLATLGVVAASALFGIVPVFARSLTDAGMAAHAVAFYRYVLAVAVLALGIYPAPLIDMMQPSVDNLISHITQSKLALID